MNPIREEDSESVDVMQYVHILLRRRWIVLCVAVISSAGVGLVTYTTVPTYQSSALIIIEKERGGGSAYSENRAVENTQADYYQTQYMLLKSYSLLEQVYNQLKLEDTLDFGHGVGVLSEAVFIKPVRGTRLVNINVEAHDAKLTAVIANNLAETFVNQNLNNQMFISKDILNTLQSDPDTREGRFAYDSLPAVVNNAVIQGQKAELSKLEAQMSDLSNRYKGRHPTIVSLRSNMETLQRQIKDETDRVVQSLKTDLSGKLRGNNVRIVDAARVPGAPYKPNKPRNIGIGLLGGLIAGFLAALLVETLDQSIRTQDDVADKLRMPSLGVIPFMQQHDDKPIYSSLTEPKLSLTSEAFRNMRTMVDLAKVADDSNAFLVTSTVQGEGKTHIASNLAVAYSQLGLSVLLIDGDMRRPRLHKAFRLTSQRGLSGYLASGKDTSEIEPLIQSTQVPNLNVLVCGPRPPNPSELLNTPRLSALVAWANANFDRVILDCTPIYPIHDTLLWGKHVRSCIFTVLYGKTRAPLIQNAHKSLEDANIKVLGVAVNAAKAGSLAYSEYGYYYQQYYHQPEPGTKPAKTV